MATRLRPAAMSALRRVNAVCATSSGRDDGRGATVRATGATFAKEDPEAKRPSPALPPLPMNHPAAASAPLTLPEPEAAALAWVRAHEAEPLPPWTVEDGEAVTREARRAVGEQADAATFLATRGRLGAERLAQRGAALPRSALASAAGPVPLVLALLLAAVLGWGVGTVGPAGRINLLAPPLLALALWNLAVYAALAVQALRRGPPSGLRAALIGLAQRTWRRAGTPRTGRPAGALPRFLPAWAQATAPLQAARVAALLHAAAAMLAAAALAALYARGLAFEYRAGWESTFLSAAAVHRGLTLVLGPASALSGLPLPDVASLEALRFSRGGGENAARWIHLHALTLTAVVVLPRLLLAAAAAGRARRLRGQVPVPEGADLRRLVQAHRGVALPVRVTPFSYRPDEAVRRGLAEWLAQEHGEVRLRWDDPVTDPEAPPGATPAPGELPVLLFALTATPERETHGAFLQAQAGRTGAGALQVVVDESGFRRRFPGSAGVQRLEQRRAAWQRLLDDLGLCGHFADLGVRPTETA